jgi:hypothetical protein
VLSTIKSILTDNEANILPPLIYTYGTLVLEVIWRYTPKFNIYIIPLSFPVFNGSYGINIVKSVVFKFIGGSSPRPVLFK